MILALLGCFEGTVELIFRDIRDFIIVLIILRHLLPLNSFLDLLHTVVRWQHQVLLETECAGLGI